MVVIGVFLLWIHNDVEYGLYWRTLLEYTVQKDEEQKVHVIRQDGSELELSMDEYLQGVIPSEMPVSFELEALKAQAVAARTYVVQRGYEVDDTVQTQVYYDIDQQKEIWGSSYDTYADKVKQAVSETKDEIMTYEGEVISAVFFSSSCGKTANADEYWENEVPYLQSVDSSWDKEEDDYEQTVEFSEEEFAEKLGFENEVSQIEEPSYYESGYVKSIEIDGIVFSGREVRELLELRSSCFSIEKKDTTYYVTTKGYGHGIGMSQYGAQAMAESGKTYDEILKHYYQGIEIEEMDV